MGRTASTRDILSGIAYQQAEILQKINKGDGGSGGQIPEDYLYTLGNIDTITLYGGKPLTVEAHQITEDTTIINTDLSFLDSMSITYKNGINIGCEWQGFILLNMQYEDGNNDTQQEIYFNDSLNSTNTIRCESEIDGAGQLLWSITIQ